jgi:hypothetical protein
MTQLDATVDKALTHYLNAEQILQNPEIPETAPAMAETLQGILALMLQDKGVQLP